VRPRPGEPALAGVRRGFALVWIPLSLGKSGRVLPLLGSPAVARWRQRLKLPGLWPRPGGWLSVLGVAPQARLRALVWIRPRPGLDRRRQRLKLCVLRVLRRPDRPALLRVLPPVMRIFRRRQRLRPLLLGPERPLLRPSALVRPGRRRQLLRLVPDRRRQRLKLSALRVLLRPGLAAFVPVARLPILARRWRRQWLSPSVFRVRLRPGLFGPVRVARPIAGPRLSRISALVARGRLICVALVIWIAPLIRVTLRAGLSRSSPVASTRTGCVAAPRRVGRRAAARVRARTRPLPRIGAQSRIGWRLGWQRAAPWPWPRIGLREPGRGVRLGWRRRAGRPVRPAALPALEASRGEPSIRLGPILRRAPASHGTPAVRRAPAVRGARAGHRVPAIERPPLLGTGAPARTSVAIGGGEFVRADRAELAQPLLGAGLVAIRVVSPVSGLTAEPHLCRHSPTSTQRRT
jgi:hypothetical protein